MDTKFTTLDVPATATTGKPLEVQNYLDKWVQLVGVTAAGATFIIEGTIDTVNWVSLVLGVTTDGIYEIPQNIQELRLNRTVAGSGVVTAAMLGRSYG